MKLKTLKDLKIYAATQNRPDERFQAGVGSCKFFTRKEAIKWFKSKYSYDPKTKEWIDNGKILDWKLFFNIKEEEIRCTDLLHKKDM